MGRAPLQVGGPIGVFLPGDGFPIVHPGTAQLCCVQPEPQRMHQMQCGPGIGAEPHNITRIGGNLRLIQNDMEHVQRPRLNLEFCQLPLRTPLVLLSGCVGFGDEYTRVAGFSLAEVGAVCLKGTTLHPRLGNPAHRVCETPAGMLNAIGLQNPGAHAVVTDILPTLDTAATHYIANVSGSTVEEYAEVTAIFDASPVAAIEVNISCPNVKEGGVLFGNSPEMSARVVAACRAQTNKPLIVKLSPNQTDIADNARRCIAAGADAFAVINTLSGMRIDIHQRKPVLGNRQGGLSGPAIKPIALLKVHQVYQVCKAEGIPIIGQGGICTGEDALEFLLAGATALGVGTALFYNPLVCQEINVGILEYMQRYGISQVTDLIGALADAPPPVVGCGCN